MKKRKPLAFAAVLLILASVNLQSVFASDRAAHISTPHTLRLISVGMLIGVALTVLAAQLKRKPE
jgi:hypothetical protein